MPAPRRWFLRKKFWIPAATALLVGLFLLFGVDPLVEWRTREALKLFEPYYVVTYQNAALHPTRLDYELTHLKVTKTSAGGVALPYIEVDRMELRVYGHELLKLHLVGVMNIEKPHLNLIAAHSPAQQQLDPGIPDFSNRLLAALPLTLDRVQVRDAEVTFTDQTNPDFPKVWFRAIDATVENLAVVAALSKGEPTSLAVAGTLQESGAFSAFFSADPLAKARNFAGRAQITNFQLKELSKVMASETGLTAEAGTLDLFAELECRGGVLTGGVKPIFKDVKVVQGKPGVGNAIAAVLADGAVKLLSSDRGGERPSLATVVPIRGEINAPDLELWPAIGGVLRNAFVLGITEGYGRLTLPEPSTPARSKPGPPVVAPEIGRR